MYCFYFRPNFLRDLKKIEQIIQNIFLFLKDIIIAIFSRSIQKESSPVIESQNHFETGGAEKYVS